ncbi:MAG: PEP-utilizing enzyme, partial [Candidatus Omnitrophica bacterium]|nr:PEP-utilizing enzyme [Candidatus Omnitrophota bacterium]
MKLREPWKRYIGGKILTLRLISFVLLLSLLTPRGVIVFTAYSESYRRIRDAGSFTNAAVFFEDLVKLPPDQAKKIAGTKMYEAALMLAIMKEHALDGFVVSGEASIKFIKSNRDMDYRVDGERVGDLAIFIKEKLGNLDTMVPQDIERISQQIREAVNNAKLPEALKQEIRNKYGILSNREGYPNLDLPVAVRSAGILEDLPFDVGSAAGRHDTYLNVKGQDEVVARYQNDVASLYTARAIGYRDYQIIFSFMQALGREGVSRLVNKLKSDAGGQWTKDVIEAIGDFDHPQLLKVSSYRIAKVLERNNLQEELDILNREKDAYINPEKLAISVGVMTMGNFDSSYVIFGAEPNSGWTAMSFQEIQPNEYFNKGRVFIVTVNYKLGEAIVQGMVTPDRYLVHVFRDKNGKQHVNILEKTLGNKGIQVVYVDELLAAVGLNKDESLEVTEALKTYRIQHSAQGIKLSERVKSLIFKNPATPPLEAFFDALNRLAEVREDMAEEVKIDQTLLSQLKINQTQLIQLAHLAKKFLKDPKSGVVNTFVPKEMRVRFSNFDYQVMDTIEQVAMKLAENYNNIIDIEGGRGNVRNILDNPVSVQRRPLTSQLDIKSPNVLNLTRTVIDEERLEELQKSKIQLAKGIYAGQIIGQGVKGRNAFSGRIFHIDESKGPLEAQFAQATQYASQLESQNEKMIIFTRETTPDYEPVMKLSTGGMSLIGSDTSHAAIISRELKIAWVVGMQTYFEELKRNKPEEYENIINYLQTPGALVTVDANNGIVYAGRVPIKEERVDIQINRLPKVSTKIGLIIGLPQLMRELSKLTQYESSYDISLQRMEFIFAAMGIYPRAGLAYDNLLIWNYLKTRQDPSYKSKLSEIERLALSRLEMDLALRAQAREQLRKKGLDPLQKFPLSEIEEKIKIGNVGAFESGLDKYAKADMEILRNGSKESRDVLRKIYYKTEGFISFGEYYDQFVGGAVGGMAAASSLDGTVAVRSLDFKLNESIANLIGADLFHKREPATMIGERGARWALKPENLKTLKKEIKMILTQVKN